MAESERSSQLFSNGLYDKLKFLALVLLPALATLWFGIGSLWNLTHTTEIVGTITLIDTFLGVILQQSTKNYYKNEANFDGDVNVTPEDGGNKVGLALDKPMEDIVDEPGKHSVELRINRLSE